ncbi:SRPBCC family protein [Rhodococcus koreensis]
MRVEVVKTVATSIDNAWALVSDFGSPHKVDPNIETLSAKGEGVGAVREIALPEGASAIELCVVCDPETFTLVYTILPPAPAVPLKNYVSTVRLKWAGHGRTEVSWVQVSEFTPDDNFPITEDEFAEMARSVYTRFIDGLERSQ